MTNNITTALAKAKEEMRNVKIELIKYGFIVGFLKEKGNFVVYLGVFLVAFTNFTALNSIKQ